MFVEATELHPKTWRHIKLIVSRRAIATHAAGHWLIYRDR